MRTVIYNYDKKSQADYLMILNDIIFGCDGNTNFPNFPVAIATLITRKADYELKLDESKSSHQANKEAVAIKKEINVIIKRNGIYINEKANGDLAKLESTGYKLSQIPKYKPKPEISIKQLAGTESIKIRIRKVKGALAYLIQYGMAPLPQTEDIPIWHHVALTTKTFTTFEGLQPLVLYWIRYKSVSPQGETQFSEPFPITLLPI